MDDDILSSIYVLGTAFAYCLPTFIALGRGHPNCIPILVVNLSLGWTVIGWVGALAWALKGRQRAHES
ncbi:MAG: superinfection immunity protein [Nitrospira sp.]|nr:superinfection immunity protein [Nitrospira sp.]